MPESGNARRGAAGAAVPARASGPAEDSTAPAVVHPGTDRVTILATFGRLATKVLGPGPDGRLAVLEGYGPAEHFRCATALVHGRSELLGRLQRLAACHRSLLIRGEALDATDRRRCKKRPTPTRRGAHPRRIESAREN